MCQNMANVDSAKSVVDFRNQPVPMAFDVEDRPFPHGVRARKSLSYVCQISPFSLLRNPKPHVQRNVKVAAPRDGLLALLAADYVNALRWSKSAFLRFASCEPHTSRNANLSSRSRSGSLSGRDIKATGKTFRTRQTRLRSAR